MRKREAVGRRQSVLSTGYRVRSTGYCVLRTNHSKFPDSQRRHHLLTAYCLLPTAFCLLATKVAGLRASVSQPAVHVAQRPCRPIFPGSAWARVWTDQLLAIPLRSHEFSPPSPSWSPCGPSWPWAGTVQELESGLKIFFRQRSARGERREKTHWATGQKRF
jgi:hypothetical protein